MAKNGIFIKAFDWLVENKGVNGQKGLAEALGISQNTISRIMTGKVEPSDDTLRKLSQEFGFNMQWLRGEDPDHMLIDDASADAEPVNQDNMVNETIEALKKQIAILEKRIEDKEAMLRMKDKFINMLEYQLDMSKRDSGFHNQPASLMATDPMLEPEK